MIWVDFHDMHSGGDQKEDWGHIYIECDSIEQAKIIFYNVFDHNPDRVTCTCCGNDYIINSKPDLAQLTGYERHCDLEDNVYVEKLNPDEAKYDQEYIPLESYLATVKVIYNKEITAEQKIGDLPAQGYVWVG